MGKKLKRKYYREFLSCFRYLNYAGLIISGDLYKSRVKQMTHEISDVVNNFKIKVAAFLKNVIDETESNLYSIAKEDREIYVMGILRDFADIAPYLNYTAKKEYFNEFGKRVVKIGDKTFPSCIDYCHKLIIRYELKYTQHIDDLEIPEKYIILCYRIYKDFFNRLDAICQVFNIDLVDIQQRLNLQIFPKEIIKQKNIVSSLDSVDDKKDITKHRLSVKKIALIHVYKEEQITRKNADEIAAKYGYTSKTSGEGLFQDYTYYCSTANRKALPIPCTPKKLQNKINLIESVIQMLPEDKQSRVKDELSILQNFYNSEYQ